MDLRCRKSLATWKRQVDPVVFIALYVPFINNAYIATITTLANKKYINSAVKPNCLKHRNMMEQKNYRPRPIIELNALQHIHHNTASSFHGIHRKNNTWKSLSFFASFRPCKPWFFFRMAVWISSIAKSLYINTCVDLGGFRYLDGKDCGNPQQTRVLSGFVMPFAIPIIRAKPTIQT